MVSCYSSEDRRLAIGSHGLRCDAEVPGEQACSATPRKPLEANEHSISNERFVFILFFLFRPFSFSPKSE